MTTFWDADRSWSRLQVGGFGAGATIGLLAVILVGVQENSTAGALRLIGVAVLVGAAALAAGVFIGFLFGVPRINSDLGGPHRYGANTNIEQISDWLTKILIGVALVELRAIASGLGDLFTAIGDSLAITEGTAFAGGLVVYFVTLGFFSGWVLTRLHLPQALSMADRLAEDAFKQKILEARQATEQNDFVAANKARAEAAQILEDAGFGP